MADENSPPIFVQLTSDYTPELVTFTIKLMPSGENSFNVPPAEIVAEMGPCLKYIMARFAGKCINNTGLIRSPEASPQGKIGPIKKVDRQQARMAKTLDGSANRALQVLEHDLKLAKEDGDEKAIARAEAALNRGKIHKEIVKKEHADEEK